MGKKGEQEMKGTLERIKQASLWQIMVGVAMAGTAMALTGIGSGVNVVAYTGLFMIASVPVIILVGAVRSLVSKLQGKGWRYL